MASVPPLPQLRTPQQQELPDYAGNYERLAQLGNSLQTGQLQRQGLQQENDLRQLQLNDQKTLRTLSPNFITKDPNGKVTGFDYEGLFNKAAQSGVSPMTLSTFQKSISDASQAKATASKTQLENEGTVNQQAFGHLEGLRGTQDPAQRQQVWTSALQWAQQNAGTLKSLNIDPAQLPQQAPDDNGLSLIEASLGMHAQQIADASKVAETNRTNAMTASAQAEADQKNQELKYGPSGLAADSKYRFLQSKLASKQPLSPDDQAWMKGYEKQKLLVPATTANIRIQGAEQGRQDAATQRYVTAAQSDLQKQFSAASTQLDKVHDAQNLLTNGGNAGDVLASIKTLSSLAGGQGSGVRITQAELNGVLHNQGIKGNIESWLSQAQGEGTMSPQRRDEINRVLAAAEAELQKKMSQQDQYMDRLTGAKNPDEVNSIKSEYRKSLYQPGNSNGGSTGAIAVGSVITQNGHRYKVTAVDKSGKPSAAEPLEQ